MHKHAGAFGALAIIALLVAPVLPAQSNGRVAESTRSTPPSAFLRRQVRTKEQLLTELNSDAGARKGYGKLFHIAPWAVVTFVRQHTSPVAMPVAGKYTVWRVTSEGTVYPTVQNFSREQRIFTLHGVPRGLPNFISAEGDPMKPFATAVTVVEVRPAPVTRIVSRVSPSQETIVPTQPQVAIVPVGAPVYAVPNTKNGGETPASGGGAR